MTDHHQHICPWWLAYTFDNPLRRFFHKPERMFASYVRPGMTVADIGCGMGYFSLGLARLVQSAGRVIAVDVQPQMLARTSSRSRRAGLAGIVETRLCDGVSLGLREPLDFVLAFWMVHETANPADFFRQIKAVLKPAGRLLVAEPKMHVTPRQFDEMRTIAQNTGLIVTEEPRVAFSRTVLLESA
ncbi:MAG: methyltransferase domain-containing protein [Desulfobacteraceae bacterium]|nr:methyltransferase domain-containing protein [Desulfobacteraceae bacterium]